MNIMVLHDETFQVESLTRGIRGRGHRVLQASDAQRALHMLTEANPPVDLIITDDGMSIRKGEALVEYLRENREEPPVVIMITRGREDLALNPLRLVCERFIEKPFTLDELMKQIERSR